jgi:hypothetical protein
MEPPDPKEKLMVGSNLVTNVWRCSFTLVRTEVLINKSDCRTWVSACVHIYGLGPAV